MSKLKAQIKAEIDAMAEAGFHINIDDGFPCCCDMESVKTLGFSTNPSGYRMETRRDHEGNDFYICTYITCIIVTFTLSII